MPFTIDEESLLIKGRKGDTAAFTFDFKQDISAYTVSFYVKKNMNTSDLVIEKKYANPVTTAVTVNLTTTDTKSLAAQANSYSTYYWGLRLSSGKDFAQTIIPKGFKTPPMMYIYPEIGG